MTGAAIATAGMGVVNGIGARNDAKDAQKSSDASAAQANAYIEQAAEAARMGVGYSEEALKQLEESYGKNSEQYRQALEQNKLGLGQSELALGQQQQGLEVMKDNQAMASNFSNFMNSLGEQGMEYAQGLMDSWESSFGGIQDNLTEYYNNLDPEKFATQNKADYKANLDKQMSQFNETMAANGLQSAGMKQQTAKEAMFKTAEANSQIDLAADDQVAQMKQGFLQFGEGQRGSAETAMGNAQSNQGQFANIGQGAVDSANRGVATAYGNVGSAYNNVGNSYNQLAQGERALGGAYAAEGNAIAQGQENIGNAYGNVANAYNNQATQANANAQNYGASAAGYENAAGNYFGNAMQAGVYAYDQYNK